MLYHYCLVLRLQQCAKQGKTKPLEHKTFFLQWSHHYLIDSTGVPKLFTAGEVIKGDRGDRAPWLTMRGCQVIQA
jgi:hypothetical protein